MSDLMSLAVTALRHDQNRIDQISLNTANAATPGYRRGVVVSIGFHRALADAQASPGTGGGAPDTLRPSAPLHITATDPTAGALNYTRRTLDVAIEGKGYFTLSDGDRTYLTRSGALNIDGQGYLVGHRGMRIQGAQGDIHVGHRQALSIDAQGRIAAEGQDIATLKLSDIAADAYLTSTDGILLSSSDGSHTDAAPDAATVRSGFLEASNSTGIHEMLDLTQEVRHFEAVIRLVQGYDEALGQAIQKLGDI